MREIKFRAWSKEHNEMWGVAYLSWVIDIAYDEPERNISSDVQMFGATNGKPVSKVGYNPAKNIVLMQYTGLKDKNGVEIYEGDILRDTIGRHYWEYRVSTIPNAKSSILYAVETFHNCSIDENDGFYTYERSDSRAGSRNELEFMQSSTEVIGNIYENPELLKEGK